MTCSVKSPSSRMSLNVAVVDADESGSPTITIGACHVTNTTELNRRPALLLILRTLTRRPALLLTLTTLNRRHALLLRTLTRSPAILQTLKKLIGLP